MRLKKILMTSLATLSLTTSAYAAPSLMFRTGITKVKFDDSFVSALTSLSVTPSAIRPSLLQNNSIIFLIPGGSFDQENIKGEIIHVGGLRLKAQNKTVDLSQFIIDTTGTAPVITGFVTVDGSTVGRIPLFDLSFPSVPLPIPNVPRIALNGVGVTLNSTAATSLNQIFNVTSFAGGLKIGTASVNAKTRSTAAQ